MELIHQRMLRPFCVIKKTSVTMVIVLPASGYFNSSGFRMMSLGFTGFTSNKSSIRLP